MLLLGKIMILQGVGHPISCLGVCYANDPKKGGYMTPAPALDLTTSLRGDFGVWKNGGGETEKNGGERGEMGGRWENSGHSTRDVGCGGLWRDVVEENGTKMGQK